MFEFSYYQVLTYIVVETGCGDYMVHDMSLLDDPCPLPDHIKKRSLNEKERLIWAPMSGVGGFVYDKDGIHIDASHMKDRQVSFRPLSSCLKLCCFEMH